MAERDIIAEAKEAFDKALECESENRNEALDDIEFAKLGKQWPELVRKQRELEGRPCLTINRLPPLIRQVVNDARQNKPAISVHPVDSDSDPETAEIFNGLIRQIEQSSDAEVAYDTALDCAVTSGVGYFRINTRYATDDSFEQDIVIERVANPFSIWGDPNSTAADSSDWNTAFELDCFTKAEFEKRWPKAEPTSFSDAGLNGYERAKGETIVVASYWTREEVEKQIVALSDGQVLGLDEYQANRALFDALGVEMIGRPRPVPSHKVTQRLMGGGDVLETVDWAGKYIPIVPVYGDEVNVEGRRYFRGLVRDAKDAARMHNYWRTTSTELVALAPKTPFIGRKGAFETDAAKWASANSETHSFIEYDGPEAPQRQPYASIPGGALQEALNAADDIKAITGIYDASLGARSNETSGRAIMARQREGDVSTFHYIDNLSRAIRHGGRIIVDLIPKVYSTPRIVRTLGAQGEQRSVPVNGAQPDPQAQQQEAAEGREQAEDIARIYDLTAGKYDVSVTVGPSFTSRREEAATQMIELIRAYPDAAPIIGDLLAKNLDWPGADEVAKRLQAMLPAQVKGGNPEAEAVKAQAGQIIQQGQQMMQQLQQENQQLKSDQAAKMRELEIKAYEAETDRLKVKNDAVLREQQQRNQAENDRRNAVAGEPNGGLFDD